MTIDNLPPPHLMAPVKAMPVDDNFGSDWVVAYQTGNSGEDGMDWAICTASVRASALVFMEFPADAKADAEAICAILNAYRRGQLVPVT